MKRAFIILLAIVAFWACGPAGNNEEQADGWINLFNGEDLTGWVQRNGEAKYHVEEGVIVGTSVLNTPNSFLCTEKDYGDFILELELMVEQPLNSGVQFRSNSLQEYKDGRVHGYQIEIDPSERAYSGGIYDEGRRGWLYPLANNEAGRKAFKNGEWNKYRIEAVGNTIRTWVNGTNCSNLVDDMTPSGFIALQVHGIGEKTEVEGKTVRWRNIRIKTENLEEERTPMDPAVEELNYVANTLTDWEKEQGWKFLWDGKTTDGWRAAKYDSFPAQGWEISEGVLTVLSSGGEESAKGGDIITTDLFSNFDLKVEFMLTEGANSGIKYFVDPELNKGKGSAIGLEFQLLDDKKHPDAKNGVDGNRTLSSLYDMITAENLSVPGRKKVFRGIGEWNQARIISKNGHVEHWLNGYKTVEFERGSEAYRELVSKSKYVKWPNFGESPEGHILLQEHGDKVSFRSVKIREL